MTTAFMNFGQTAGFDVPGRESDRDGRSREVFMSDGNSAILEARDPYGHWYIRWKSGKTPEEFSQNSFTSPDSAKKFLEIGPFDPKTEFVNRTSILLRWPIGMKLGQDVGHVS